MDCSYCKKSRQVTKSLSLSPIESGLPQVMCFHLKRFEFNTRGRQSRIGKNIQFPFVLDMGEFMDYSKGTKCATNRLKTTYELFALVVHVGSSCSSCHYLAYVKRGGQWYKANDSHVRSVNESHVGKMNPYMLFYQQRAVCDSREGTNKYSVTAVKKEVATKKRGRGTKRNAQVSVSPRDDGDNEDQSVEVGSVGERGRGGIAKLDLYEDQMRVADDDANDKGGNKPLLLLLSPEERANVSTFVNRSRYQEAGIEV